MTWGQLRFLLQTESPGVSLDLLDGYLNSRYEHVLEMNGWAGLKAHATLLTTAAHQSGADSVTLTVGSNAVTVAGATWTAAITGLKFYRPGDTALYTATYVSPGAFTLDRPYEGTGTEAAGTVFAGAAYVLMQNVYPLPADLRSVISILDPVTGDPLADFLQEGLDRSARPRTLVADPKAWALSDDSDEGAPPVLHQVELYPPPLRARGFRLEYVRAAFGFDGTNTSLSPLPWVSDSVLLYGVRADVAAYRAGQAETPAAAAPYLTQARMFEAKFDEALGRLLRVEHQQRRGPQAMRLAARLTRHRLARAGRGLNRSWGPGQGGPN